MARYVPHGPLMAREANTGDPREKPTSRDPDSGHLVIHPAFEGWAPSEPPRRLLIIVGRLIGLASLAILAANLMRL